MCINAVVVGLESSSLASDCENPILVKCVILMLTYRGEHALSKQQL